jgi:hypothetical protein
MTPDKLREALYTIGWSQRDLGDRLRIDRDTLRGWNEGTVEIPSRVGHWLAYLSDAHEHALHPSGWEFPVKQERAAAAREESGMALCDRVYNHAPKTMKDLTGKRSIQKEADQYTEFLVGKIGSAGKSDVIPEQVWGAELERLELDPETRGERGRSERPERGIEDDEELER